MKNNNYSMQKFDEAISKEEATWWEMELPSGNVFFGGAKTDMLGYNEKDFNNYKDFTNIVHPDDHKRMMKDMKNHIDGKKNLYETQYKIKNKDNQYINFYDIGKIISNIDGKIKLIGFVWKIKNDVDIKKQMKDFRDLILEGKPSIIDLFKKVK